MIQHVDAPETSLMTSAVSSALASSSFSLLSLRRGVVGHGAHFEGPFGRKTMLYADWTASGRALKPIEDYMQHEVLPMYANTHTTTSSCGLQSTCFRQEARQVIAQACNARVGYSDKHADVVVFAGNGSTGAINKLTLILGMHLPLPKNAPPTAQPVVILGPHEHHSNILPWRESSAKVIEIPESKDGGIDRAALRTALRDHASHSLVIGSFSAASNVTGVVADVDGITEELHQAGALAFWDYAAAAPYLNIDMNPVKFLPDGSLNPYVYKDAIFISPHKLPGGPGTPGILVAKRSLFVNDVPAEPGGGTVFFVTGSDQRYLSNRHEREEGGTQDIVGSIRAGLAFQVKQRVGESVIAAAENSLGRKLYDSLAGNPNIAILGPPYRVLEEGAAPSRLPIVSFLIRGPADSKGRSRFLHHSFVCAVLNDVFGVQVRGGCACAGPYALELLGIEAAAAAALETLLLDQAEVMRPGFVRLSLPYFASNAEVEYALSAVHAVANHGWRLLTLYRLDTKTGEWRHKSRARSFPERKWLAHLNFPTTQGPVHNHGDEDCADPARIQPVRLSEAELEKAFVEQLAAGIELMEQCGQIHAGGRQQQHLRVPNLNELEISGEQNMLVSGTRDDDDSDRVRLPYESCGEGENPVAKSTHPSRAPLRISPETADSLRWFMFPSEGAALLRSLLPQSVPRLFPRSGPHLPLSIQPTPGRLAGLIRPLGYDDTRGLKVADVPAWPTGVEYLISARETHDKDAQGRVLRTISSKYPLRSSSNGDCNTGGLAHQLAMKFRDVSSSSDDITPNGTFMKPGGPESIAALNKLVDVSSVAHPALAPEKDELHASSSASGDKNDKVVVSGDNMDSVVDSDMKTHVSEPEATRTVATAKGQPSLMRPPQKLLSLVSKAVSEWQMIVPGDRVLLGLSGGKDSLAMLHLLKALQKRYPPGTFELACCTIDPGTDAFNPRPLIAYVESLGIKYHYNEERIMDMAAEHMTGDSICAFCARMKRGALYSCMREHGYNKLVLAQHLDDVVESFFMSAMHNGLIRTMKAAYVVDEGDLTVIRPGIYCRERQLRDFSYAAGLPVINENCPACFEAPKERHHIKKLLSREEGMFPTLYSSLRKALLPLLDPAATDLLAAVRRALEVQTEVGRQALRQRASRKLQKNHEAHAARRASKETPLANQPLVDTERCNVADPTVKNQRLLAEASETELLAELVQRRQKARRGGRFQADSTHLDLEAKMKTAGDKELEQDIVDLNQFCSADVCVKKTIR